MLCNYEFRSTNIKCCQKQQTDKNETLLDLCGVYNTKIKGSLHIQLQTNVICMSNNYLYNISYMVGLCILSA